MNNYKKALNHYRALEKSMIDECVNSELLQFTRIAIKAIEQLITTDNSSKQAD